MEYHSVVEMQHQHQQSELFQNEYETQQEEHELENNEVFQKEQHSFEQQQQQQQAVEHVQACTEEQEYFNNNDNDDAKEQFVEQQNDYTQEGDNDDEDENNEDVMNCNEINSEEFAKLTKNQKRKYKKKMRNKQKRLERELINKRRQEWSKIYIVKKIETIPVEDEKNLAVEDQEDHKDNDTQNGNNNADDDEMEIDEEDMPEEDKEDVKKPDIVAEYEQQNEPKKPQVIEPESELQNEQSDGDDEDEFKNEKVTIEYVPEEIEKDRMYVEFLNVFDKFSAVSHEEAVRIQQENMTEKERAKFEREKLLELKRPKLPDDDDDEDEEGSKEKKEKLSNRKSKMLARMGIAVLKQQVKHPELVEMHDVTAKDPVLLLQLKSTRNSVPVPRHWSFKRKYLQGKRGFEKPPFKLPEFIRRTGIQEMREAVQEKEDGKTLKRQMREKIRPKMGKIDIDYQKLHDAFFKWQTKPVLSIHGDLYWEGKEFETKLRDKKPGELSNELRAALGMPTGPNANKCPPPWLIAMQRYGPPPSYPALKIAGLNAPIPEGCTFGYHAGGWGKPPVDVYGRPLYGDVFGTSAPVEVTYHEEIDKTKWGLMESDEEEDDEDEDEDANEDDDMDMEGDDGLVTPGGDGLVTPSGLNSVPAGIETPDMFELRKRKQQIEADMDSGENPQLFQVIPEKSADRLNKDMMGSMHIYDFASLSKNTVPSGTKSKISSSGDGIDVAIDPSELEDGALDDRQLLAKYEQKMREQGGNNPHEDFSDMVAEHVSKQKKKKDALDKSKSKKYQFKF